MVTGPVGSSSMATYQSVSAGSAVGLLARPEAACRSSSSSPGELIWVCSPRSSSPRSSSRASSSRCDGGLGSLGPSRSEAPPRPADRLVGVRFRCAVEVAGSRTSMMWLHFLQRILRIFPRTFSSLMEYLALQLSQTKRMNEEYPAACVRQLRAPTLKRRTPKIMTLHYITAKELAQTERATFPQQFDTGRRLARARADCPRRGGTSGGRRRSRPGNSHCRYSPPVSARSGPRFSGT